MTEHLLLRRLKIAVMITLCIIAVIASTQTVGLTRALIELLAFGGLIWLALTKPDMPQNDA
ncbi:hypothetical protein [Shewanella polaris]|uniref:Uncharacterized protein n=1 Tax=Shewanella polaris TaxID=2588449 RepID=A0A4Y5YJQ5_9GAMM|nr:hypothetical protein [Shewanella polaris]QDE33001.1 hypothetical protein FH971_19730 [Shewanella polaris]